MTEEIINLNGIEYKIEYSGYLTYEQKIQAIVQYLDSGKCSGCVKSLSKVCNITSKSAPGTINLSYTPSAGTGPFTVDYYRQQGANPKTQTGITNAHQTSVATGTITSASYAVQSTDSGDWNFWAEGLDACSGTTCGSSASADSCIVTLNPILNSITVTSPNGAEQWAVGSTHSITWNYTGLTGTTVKIDLVVGASILNLATAQPIGTSYSWNIQNTLTGGSNYKIRVTSNFDTSILDESNSTFTIVDKGDVYVSSNPTGAAITIDSVPQTFPTNSTVTGLTVGSHQFTLTKAGYNVYSGNFTIIAGTTVDACTPAPCQLVVTPTTQPPTTQPATTQPATTLPATTQAATTQPPTTLPATTQPPTTQPQTTLPPTGYILASCKNSSNVDMGVRIYLDGGALPVANTPVTLSGPAIPTSVTHTIVYRKVLSNGSEYPLCTVQNINVTGTTQTSPADATCTSTLCKLITALGGYTAIRSQDIIYLIRNYMGSENLGFPIGSNQLVGCINYYQGRLDGNLKTGCNCNTSGTC